MFPLFRALMTGWEKARAVVEIVAIGAEAWSKVDERRQARADRERDAQIADLQRQVAWLHAQSQAAQSGEPEPKRGRR